MAQTVGDLGEKLSLESNTLTPLLKRLESEGYVARRRDAEDERQVRIKLTAQGRALQGKARDIPRCVLAATGLSATAAHRLKGDVEALRESLLKAEPSAKNARRSETDRRTPRTE